MRRKFMGQKVEGALEKLRNCIVEMDSWHPKNYKDKYNK